MIQNFLFFWNFDCTPAQEPNNLPCDTERRAVSLDTVRDAAHRPELRRQWNSGGERLDRMQRTYVCATPRERSEHIA
jgi:hypothetical protein